MIIERRAFYAQVGKAQDVVDVSKQFLQGTKQAGIQASSLRILTDVTGKTDRVIVEIGVEGLAHLQEMNRRLPGDLTQGTLQQLINLIDGADVELLSLAHMEEQGR